MNTNTLPGALEPVAAPLKRAWGAWATAGFGLAILGLLLAMGIVAGVILGAAWLVSDPSITTAELSARLEQNQGLVVAVSAFLSAAISLPMIVFMVRARRGMSVGEYLGLKRIGWRTVLALLGLTILLLLMSAGLDAITSRPTNDFDIRIYETSVWPPLLWIALVIFAPLFEETLFRGFLFEGFRQSRLGPVVTVVVVAAAWSSLHIQYDIYGMATIFVLGLVLGAVRLRTGSLWAPLLMHAFWNLAATVQMGLATGG